MVHKTTNVALDCPSLSSELLEKDKATNTIALMSANSRNLLDCFAARKTTGRKSETVRVKCEAVPPKSLIGTAKGKIKILGDLTKPTL
jgi:hypothetical protein